MTTNNRIGVTVPVLVAAVVKILSLPGKDGKAVNKAPIFAGADKSKGSHLAQRLERMTGFDLTAPGTLHGIVIGSDGKLFTDGLSIWNAAEQIRRASRSKIGRDASTAKRALYRGAAEASADAQVLSVVDSMLENARKGSANA